VGRGREGGGAVRRRRDAPFAESTVDDLAGWADGRLDISHEHVDPLAAQTVVAARFGGFDAVERMTFVQYMAALQLLAEERTGTRQRQQQGAEDAAFAEAVQAAKKAGS
jgi:hypothetical protein